MAAPMAEIKAQTTFTILLNFSFVIGLEFSFRTKNEPFNLTESNRRNRIKNTRNDFTVRVNVRKSNTSRVIHFFGSFN